MLMSQLRLNMKYWKQARDSQARLSPSHQKMEVVNSNKGTQTSQSTKRDKRENQPGRAEAKATRDPAQVASARYSDTPINAQKVKPKDDSHGKAHILPKHN
ncbi:Uncharacterized protein Fot_37384 [Forsythia ovata]|uniref:Uncharacterized protein n=1 Tax=Forsythia ovata TaxID=205694 RepID=A0ABD1S170_9LAMI